MKAALLRRAVASCVVLLSFATTACTSMGVGFSIPIGGFGSVGISVGSDGRVSGGVQIGHGGLSVGLGGTADLPRAAPVQIPAPVPPAVPAPAPVPPKPSEPTATAPKS